MHQCTHCQAELPANAQFCRHCGTPIPIPGTDTTTQQEETDNTSKLPVVSATPLPALRTRRMHPQSSISAVPPDPWLSTTPEQVDLEISTRTAPGQHTPRPQARSFPAGIFSATPPPVSSTGRTTAETENAQPDFPDFEEMETFEETKDASSQTDLAENETEDTSSPTDLPETETEDASSPTDLVANETEIGGETEVPTAPLAEEPSIEMLDTASLPAQPVEETHSTYGPAGDPPIETRATGSLPVEKSGITEASSSPATTPPPTWPTMESVPSSQPIVTAPTPVETPRAPFPSTPAVVGSAQRVGRKRKGILLAALVIALIVLVGASVLAFRQQIFSGINTPPGSPTSIHKVVTQLAFSGAVAGSMAEITPVSCREAAAGDLHTLTVTLSGIVHNQLYNFGFTIGHYNGPGIYTNASSANSLTVLLNLPGESTINGWGNTDPTANGSITIDRGGQTGSISYTLSGFGKQTTTQIQVSGTWSCQ